MRWRRGDRGHHRTRAKLTAIAESIKGETNDARRNQPAGDAVTLKAMFVYGNPDSPPHAPHGVEGRARSTACLSFALRQDHQGRHGRYRSAAHSRQAHGKGNGRKAMPAKAQSQRNVASQKGGPPNTRGNTMPFRFTSLSPTTFPSIQASAAGAMRTHFPEAKTLVPPEAAACMRTPTRSTRRSSRTRQGEPSLCPFAEEVHGETGRTNLLSRTGRSTR